MLRNLKDPLHESVRKSLRWGELHQPFENLSDRNLSLQVVVVVLMVVVVEVMEKDHGRSCQSPQGLNTGGRLSAQQS